MNKTLILILKIICAFIFVTSCKMEHEKKKHYAKKYSAMVVSDVALSYTCKTALALGTPVCMGVDILGDVGIVTYYNNKYNAQQEEKSKITGEPFERKTFHWGESALDFGMFLAILLLIP